MSVGSVLKKVAGGAAGVGKALGVLEEAGPQVVPAAAAPSAAPAQEDSPFSLPEIAPDDPDREEKQAIHNAYMELYKRLAPDDGINYREKYGELEKYVNSRPEPRHWSPFSSFAIAMGSPAGAQKVASDNARATDAHSEREANVLRLREEALKGEIAQLAQKGNFKKMLTQTALLEELARTQKLRDDAREHKQKIDEIEAQNKGKLAVAGVRASSALRVAQERANALADRYKLNYEARRAMLSLASHMIGGFQAQKDAAGEPVYAAEDMDRMARELVDYAEEHSPVGVDNSPTKPTVPTTKPKAEATTGVGPNPTAAALFAKRRAEREAATKK